MLSQTSDNKPTFVTWKAVVCKFLHTLAYFDNQTFFKTNYERREMHPGIT